MKERFTKTHLLDEAHTIQRWTGRPLTENEMLARDRQI